MNRVLLSGLAGAIFINLPFYAMMTEQYWPRYLIGSQNFFFMLLNNGLASLVTFFHEIGHTLAAWFYGIPAIPMFDFKYGGGWSWYLTDWSVRGALIAVAALTCLWYWLEDYVWLRRITAGLILFNLLTTFSEGHMAVMTFMGPAFEPVIGGFFLFRAIFDLAPRGLSERFLNALFGFALPLHSLIEGWSLLYYSGARESYFNQKGGHGSGDFDQLAEFLPALGFNGFVSCWMGLALICLALPFLLKKISFQREQD